MLKNKDLLGLKDVSSEEIMLILETAEHMKKIVCSPQKKIALFYRQKYGNVVLRKQHKNKIII